MKADGYHTCTMTLQARYLWNGVTENKSTNPIITVTAATWSASGGRVNDVIVL